MGGLPSATTTTAILSFQHLTPSHDISTMLPHPGVYAGAAEVQASVIT